MQPSGPVACGSIPFAITEIAQARPGLSRPGEWRRMRRVAEVGSDYAP